MPPGPAPWPTGGTIPFSAAKSHFLFQEVAPMKKVALVAGTFTPTVLRATAPRERGVAGLVELEAAQKMSQGRVQMS